MEIVSSLEEDLTSSAVLSTSFILEVLGLEDFGSDEPVVLDCSPAALNRLLRFLVLSTAVADDRLAGVFLERLTLQSLRESPGSLEADAASAEKSDTAPDFPFLQ